MKHRRIVVGLAIVLCIATAITFAVWRRPKVPDRPLTAEEKSAIILDTNVAIGQLENGDYAEAAAYFEKLAEQLPNEPLPFRNLAIARAAPTCHGLLDPSVFDTRQLHEALELMLEHDGNSPATKRFAGRLYFLLATQHIDDSAESKSRECLMECTHDWKDIGSLFDLYILEKGADSYAETSATALTALERACGRDVGNLVLRWELLRLRTAKHNFEQARRILDELLGILPWPADERETQLAADLRKLLSSWPANADDISILANQATRGDRFYDRQLEILQPHPRSFILREFSHEFYADMPETQIPPSISVSFAPVQVQGPEPLAAAVDDLNSDGGLLTIVLYADGDNTRIETKTLNGGTPLEPITVPGRYTMLKLVDLDLDFGSKMEPPDLDLVLSGPSGLRLLENRLEAGKRHWIDHPDAVKSLSGQPVNWVLVFDLNGDGHLDIVAGLKNEIRILKNQGNWLFRDSVARSRLVTEAIGMSADLGDLDADGRFCIVQCPSCPGVLSVQTNGVLVPRGTSIGGSCVHAVSFSDDGKCALVEGYAGEATIHPGHVSLPTNAKVLAVGSLDYDNDGREDIWLWTDDVTKPLRLFHNEGDGKFSDATDVLPPLPRITSPPIVADIDGDGGLDFILTTPNGLLYLMNQGGNKNHWIDVRLHSTNIMSMAAGNTPMSNFTGIGTSLELRSGRMHQRQLVRNNITHFGLGSTDRLDTLRAAWTNGIIQTEIRPEIDRLLTLTQRSR